VLAVGDQSFQAKCVERIYQFRRAGKTLLFVSHGATLVRQLCDRAIWLDHGEVMRMGTPETTLEAYFGASATAP
jgi:lipopolysaccharide transport system ATP-binding protein